MNCEDHKFHTRSFTRKSPFTCTFLATTTFAKRYPKRDSKVYTNSVEFFSQDSDEYEAVTK